MRLTRGSRDPADVTVALEVVSDGALVAPSQASKFRITVTDNGPGIVRQHIPRIFAKLLRIKATPYAYEPRSAGDRHPAAWSAHDRETGPIT
ncbi:MAG: hypothetical protein U0412_14065 [Nitrospira sp.]